MRALVLGCITFVLAGTSSSQRMRFQNFRPRPFQNSALQSGVKPDPSSPTPTGPRGCFCLPGNQVCEPSGPVPVSATRISKLTTRIVNVNPLTNCPEGQRECCFGSFKNVDPVKPPISAPVTGCGGRETLLPGRNAADADFGEYPWMTAILKSNNDYVAGGALISRQWVVTAAHKLTNPGSLKVRVGDYDLSVPNEVPEFPHEEVNVVQVVIHPDFNPTNLKNDVALLRLQRPVSINKHVNPVCIPERGQIFSGQRCFVSGWGQGVNGAFQPIMNEVDLPIVDSFQCQNDLRKTRLGSSFQLDLTSFLCAGGETGKDACSGDGGSPLVCDENGFYTVVGLVAWGIGCGQNNVPGVYVNLASYSDFISSNVN